MMKHLTNQCLTATMFLFIWLSSGHVSAQDADQVIEEMGFGFNLGNSWERGDNSRDSYTLQKYIDAYADLGAGHVRIPVTWMTPVAGGDNSIMVVKDGNWIQNINNPNHNYLEELKQTIDYCISKGLYVIINTHHEDWLKDHYGENGQFDYYDIRFDRLWTFIADEFQGYGKKLVFEVLNEPEGQFGQDGTSNVPNATNSLWTRQINQVGYDAIRNTGGNNSTRIIMVSPNGQSADQQMDDVWPTSSTLPGNGTDNNLAIQVHSYDPWGFCGQTGSTNYYTSQYGNDLDAKIKAEIEAARDHANSLGVPLHYGEFGVGRDNNQSDRDDIRVRSWHRTFVETCLNNEIAVTLWEDRGWYRYISNDANSWTYDIVPYMLANVQTNSGFEGQYYQLVNVYASTSGDKVLRPIDHANATNSGVKVDDDAASWNSGQWEFVPAITSDYYYLKNRSTGEILMVDWEPNNPTLVTLTLQDDTPTNRNYNRAQWRLEENNGAYNILNKWENHALRPMNAGQTGASDLDDAIVYGYTLDAGWSSQRWTLNNMGSTNAREAGQSEVEPSEDVSLLIYPNPATSKLFLSMESSWQLIGLSGQVLGTGKGTEINVQGIPEGIYVVKASGKSLKVVVTK
ncbi:MAG: cellulase family glycosylhydrolase [Marinoscillum sp.]